VIVSVQGREKNCTTEVWSVLISDEMAEEVPAVVADNKQVNGKERNRQR
jgi:hypothetical protein